ncbi:4816_t:CDS:2 [Rhizophagus irregularis]|nr:4816_t:CDS:2 [Rhizophagus irregularis]
MLSPLSLFNLVNFFNFSLEAQLLIKKRRQQTTIVELHCKDILGTSSAGDQCVRNLFSITIKQPNFRARVALRNHELRGSIASVLGNYSILLKSACYKFTEIEYSVKLSPSNLNYIDCLNQQEAELQLLYPLQFVDTKNNWSFEELKNRDTANSRIRKCAG